MIRFKIRGEQVQEDSFWDLCDWIRNCGKEYPNTMLGSFCPQVRLHCGIVLDGDCEKELADDFEKLLLLKGRVYNRLQRLGRLYFRCRAV